MQKVTKKWPDTPLWLIDKPMGKFRKNVWDSVLDLIFCTPFQYFLQKVPEGCAKIEVKLMSRVLGKLWGHQGRLWECLGVAGVTPESSRASKLAPRASKLTPWGVQVGFKSVSVGSKSVQVHPRLFQEGAKGCLLYTSPSPRDISGSRMPSSA